MEKEEKTDNFQDILDIEEELMNFFEDVMYDRGSSPLLGRIYGTCVINTSNKLISQKYLINKFKVNPSTISRNLKELENWHLIQRKRQPGSLEWEYRVEQSSFLELFSYQIEKQRMNLPERRSALTQIREHWKNTLSKESKQDEKAIRDLKILDLMIKWIIIVEEEFDSLIGMLHTRFLELEDEITGIWNNGRIR